MADTIQTTFDPFRLPTWTRKHPEVVELCKRDLAYRCDVWRTTSLIGRSHLVNTAKRQAAQLRRPEPRDY